MAWCSPWHANITILPRLCTSTKRNFLSTLFIGVAVYAASNLSYVSPDTPFSGKMTAEIYNIRTLVDLGGMAILFAHHMQLVEYRRKKGARRFAERLAGAVRTVPLGAGQH